MKTTTQRRLWLKPEEQDLSSLAKGSESHGGDDNYGEEETYETVFARFAVRPKPKTLTFLLSNTLVVGKELVLTGLLLAGHRAAIFEERRARQMNAAAAATTTNHHQLLAQYDDNNGTAHDVTIRTDNIVLSDRLLFSLGLVWLTLVISVVQNKFATSRQYKIHHRLTDFVLMAVLLRFLSAVLKTLTASYSSDTVYALSVASLFLHVLTCDFAYANGIDVSDDDDEEEAEDDGGNEEGKNGEEYGDNEQVMASSSRNDQRPAFKGGTMSLTSAFFATTLLASRLEHNVTVYLFVCSSVVLFALYPASRHLVAVKALDAVAEASTGTMTSVISMWGEWVDGAVSMYFFLCLVPSHSDVSFLSCSAVYHHQCPHNGPHCSVGST